MKHLFRTFNLSLLYVLFITSMEAQPLEFFDIKDSLHIKEIQVHATSDFGWINIGLTRDSSILIIKHNYCGSIQYSKKFKVDTFDINNLSTTITRINNSDSIYVSATLHSSTFAGLFCLSIYASKGDIQFPKISNFPNLNFYSNPVLIANGNDRLLTFNAGINQNDITGYVLKLDNLFQFTSGIKLKDTTKIYSILSLNNDGYVMSLGDRLISKITKNLSFDYVYSLDSNYTHFGHNLEKYLDNIILLGDYNKSLNASYFTLLNFNLSNKMSSKFDKLVQYNKSLTPKLIHYGNQLVGMDNVAVSHISTMSDTQSILSISLFSNNEIRNTYAYRPSKKYTSLGYGLDFLSMESNFAMAGSFQDTFRYFSAKLNHKGSVSNCDNSNFIDTTSIETFKQDTYKLLQFEAISSPILNSTIKSVADTINYKRICKYFDFVEGTTTIPYCDGVKDTTFNVSAIAKDPISYSNNYVHYLWNTGETTRAIDVKYPYKPATVQVTYCNEIISFTYNFTPKDCFPTVLFPNVFTPASDIPENKGYSMVIKDQSRIRKAEWSIYNRWGAKVFSSNQIVDDWDGTYKGNPAPSDTYVVNAIVTDINGISKSFSEMFTLVR